MNATKIEYLNFTWSPLVGCSGIGCAVAKQCWAKYQAKRRKNKCQDCYDFKPHSHLYRGNQPAERKKPARIGVCFSADMWDQGFSREQQKIILDFARYASWHKFINLTKQPQNIPLEWIFPDNWVQGVSVNCKADFWRIDALRKTKAWLKIVSFEPLYEDLGGVDLSNIGWIIIGAQTHPLKLPKAEWVDNLVQDASPDIPVFLKNNLKSLGLPMLQDAPHFFLY